MIGILKPFFALSSIKKLFMTNRQLMILLSPEGLVCGLQLSSEVYNICLECLR